MLKIILYIYIFFLNKIFSYSLKFICSNNFNYNKKLFIHNNNNENNLDLYNNYGNFLNNTNSLYKSKNKIYIPKNKIQTEYNEYLNDKNIKLIFSLGPTCSGKSLFAYQNAIIELKKNNIEKIIIIKPLGTLNEYMGFINKKLDIEKIEYWSKSFYDLIKNYYTKNEIINLLHNDKIIIYPLSSINSRTFNNAIIISEEMQYSTPIEMKLLLSRIGNNNKMIVIGNLEIKNILFTNGIDDFLTKFNNINDKINKNIKIVNFLNEKDNKSDVEKTILQIYSNYNKYDDILKNVTNYISNNTTELNYTKLNIDNNIKQTTENKTIVFNYTNINSDNNTITLNYTNINKNITFNKSNNIKKYDNDAAIIPIHYYKKNFNNEL